MSFIVETSPVLRHKCKLPNSYFIDENELAQPSYAHLTVWQCDKCNNYWMYQDRKRGYFYPLCNTWKLISGKRAMRLKNKWNNKIKEK